MVYRRFEPICLQTHSFAKFLFRWKLLCFQIIINFQCFTKMEIYLVKLTLCVMQYVTEAFYLMGIMGQWYTSDILKNFVQNFDNMNVIFNVCPWYWLSAMIRSFFPSNSFLHRKFGFCSFFGIVIKKKINIKQHIKRIFLRIAGCILLSFKMLNESSFSSVSAYTRRYTQPKHYSLMVWEFKLTNKVKLKIIYETKVFNYRISII